MIVGYFRRFLQMKLRLLTCTIGTVEATGAARVRERQACEASRFRLPLSTLAYVALSILLYPRYDQECWAAR